MSVLNTGLAKTSAAATSYDIDNSLRFNDDDSAYLSRTFSAGGSTTTWTFSCWFKRSNLTGQQLFGWWDHSSGSVNNQHWLGLAGDTLEFKLYNGPSNTHYGRLQTNQVLRDPSAWYHLVAVWDTTNSTVGDRMRLYLNGSRITSFSSQINPSASRAGYINSTSPSRAVTIGTVVSTASLFVDRFDGYMSEVNFIDGAAKDPDNFGEFDATYGHWKPIAYAGTDYGTNGFYLPMGDSSLVSASGGDSTGTDGKYKYHIFNQDGTFAVSSASAGSVVEYLVIGGGGGGGSSGNGTSAGGGAGGYRTGRLSIASGDYAITVGDGGIANGNGGDSIFSTITSNGGGAGGGRSNTESQRLGKTGGSAGGSAISDGNPYGVIPSVSGNEGSFSPVEGYAGGASANFQYGYTNATAALGAGGGGGANASGSAGSGQSGGSGGSGRASSITSSSVTRAGGGGGAAGQNGTLGSGGSGGGGSGGKESAVGTSGSTNTGSGGGGCSRTDNTAGTGGSGVVIIRYKYQG